MTFKHKHFALAAAAATLLYIQASNAANQFVPCPNFTKGKPTILRNNQQYTDNNKNIWNVEIPSGAGSAKVSTQTTAVQVPSPMPPGTMTVCQANKPIVLFGLLKPKCTTMVPNGNGIACTPAK